MMGNTQARLPAEMGHVTIRQSAYPAGSSIFSEEAWTQIGFSLRLSGRELQIVRGAFDGKTELAIAVDLEISPSTIHTHVERLYRKLVIRDRVQLLLRITQEFLTLTAMPGSGLPPICPNRCSPRRRLRI